MNAPSLRQFVAWLVPSAVAAALLWAASGESASQAAAQATSRISAVPEVLLTEGHAKLCTVKAGDAFPAISIPAVGGGPTPVKSLYGKQATVVLFWTPDRWMSRAALADVARDVAKAGAGGDVAIVGVAVGQPTAVVQKEATAAGASFPQLLDEGSEALAQVGVEALPRIYVLDGAGKIAWFDIEYSEATRRELAATLSALTAK